MFSRTFTIISLLTIALTCGACAKNDSDLSAIQLAENQIEAGQFKLALKTLNDELAKKPQDIDLLTLRGIANLELSNVVDAINDLEKAHRNAAQDVDIMINLAAARIANKQFDKAIDLLDRALEIDEVDADAYRNRALALLKTGDFSAAISDYTLAMTIYGGIDPILYQERAECWIGLENQHQAGIDKTIAQMTIRLDDNPDDVEALKLRGLELYDLGEYELALYDLDGAIELGDQSAEIFLARGNCLYVFEENELALEDLDEAIRVNANSALAYASRANLRKSMGDLDKAVEDFKAALQIDPNNALATSQLAWMLATTPDLSIKDTAKAVELSEKLIELNSVDTWQDLEVVAAAYAANNEFEKAVQFQQRSIDKAPNEQIEQLTDSLKRYQSKLTYLANNL